ncbi:MAG: EscU/YscU/HrcU family type III secretion system export apparatus switch protein [Kofleriaceae bacterium]
MSDASERTHKPTPKRLADARKRGDVALDQDLLGAATMAAAVVALLAGGQAAIGRLLALTHHVAEGATGAPMPGLARAGLATFAACAAPVLVTAAVVAAVTIALQLGVPPTWKRPGFDLGRLSPRKNLGRVLGGGAMLRRTAGALTKLVGISAIVIMVVWRPQAMQIASIDDLQRVAARLSTEALIAVTVVLLTVGLGSYLLARRRHAASLRMSTDEIKREHKESEGSPLQRGRRRARMRELSRRRLDVAVARADVVLVNPTHYAVALRYDEAGARPPLVVAKGVDGVAARIRERARQAGVPILSRPPLARALHAAVPEGREIPPALYQAVAEVLAYVYRLRRRVA